MTPAVVVFGVLRDRLPGVTIGQFIAKTAAFEFLPVTVCGRCVGAIMRRGSELHAAVLPEARGRWIGRKVLAVVADTVEQHGCATTAVMDGHKPGHIFALRLGFEAIKQADGMTHYRKMP